MYLVNNSIFYNYLEQGRNSEIKYIPYTLLLQVSSGKPIIFRFLFCYLLFFGTRIKDQGLIFW